GEALGAVGAARPLPNFIDCVVSGSGEYWLDVADNAATFLSFLQSRTSWSKLVFAENAANGAREFFRHQFTQYARFFRDSVCDLDANAFLGDGEA
ncbi:MAG: hypothetical protein HUK22_07730, partial [Thermoguttaceae bacterium]|nr:hypothetical protein [Thermoguttaceae bacterium]